MQTYKCLQAYLDSLKSKLSDFPVFSKCRPSPALEWGEKEQQFVNGNREALKKSTGLNDWVFITFIRRALQASQQGHGNRRFDTYAIHDEEPDATDVHRTANVVVDVPVKIWASSFHLTELIEEYLYLFPIDEIEVDYGGEEGIQKASVERTDFDTSEVYNFGEHGPMSYLEWTAKITFPLHLSKDQIVTIIKEITTNIYIE